MHPTRAAQDLYPIKIYFQKLFDVFFIEIFYIYAFCQYNQYGIFKAYLISLYVIFISSSPARVLFLIQPSWIKSLLFLRCFGGSTSFQTLALKVKGCLYYRNDHRVESIFGDIIGR